MIIKPDEEVFEEVDAIIVTPILEYKEIKNMLKSKINTSIISIKEVILEV